MSTFAKGFRQLRCQAQLAKPQWPQYNWQRSSLQLGIRSITTQSSKSAGQTDSAALMETSQVETPFLGVEHARAVPSTPSYFSREPHFNDMFLRISRLLTKYHHLPTLPPNEAPLTPWVKLQEMRSNLGEPIKASHYAKVMRVAKRLNMIEPSLFPEDVTLALDDFKRHFNPYDKKRIVQTPDNYGRAVGSGRRKESTARAWVVEGTGEVLINGKPLNQAFGRVHDRESAIWALQATERLDKYNVWALVEGGGTTGQAEAMTLAVAKALIVHEPALKTALKRAGCITRDARTVERKKHGHVKARKMPAWVKR